MSDVTDNDHKLNRVTSNPDGLIISDSLVGILDESQLSDVIKNDSTSAVICELEFIDYNIVGNLISYRKKGQLYTYTIDASVNDARALLNESDIATITVRQSIKDDLLFEVHNFCDEYMPIMDTQIHIGEQFDRAIIIMTIGMGNNEL